MQSADDIKFALEKMYLSFVMRNSALPTVLSDKDSLNELIQSGKSIARFGDGEMGIILGKKIGFQAQDSSLSAELLAVLTSSQENCLVAVPDSIVRLENLTPESMRFWVSYMSRNIKHWLKFLKADATYLSAHITRCYIRYSDKSECGIKFNLLKKLWEGRDIVIAEGAQTRLGTGNDLLLGAKSVKRIIAPPKNAFNKIDEIQRAIELNADTGTTVLLALGPTATALAYRLSQTGYRALDIGHCDIEYEWFLKGVSEKTAVSGKHVNEVGSDAAGDAFDDTKYTDEIIARID